MDIDEPRASQEGGDMDGGPYASGKTEHLAPCVTPRGVVSPAAADDVSGGNTHPKYTLTEKRNR